MSGIDGTIAIRKEFPKAHIIIFTTFDSDTERQRALGAGASAFVLKTFGQDRLSQLLTGLSFGAARRHRLWPAVGLLTMDLAKLSLS